MPWQIPTQNPVPGGSISPFCEPETTTSQFHASDLRSIAPRPLTASTTRIAAESLTILPIDLISVATPVDVSHRVVNTALTVPLPAARCASTSPGSTALPHSTLITSAFIPYAWHISVQRSPNFPASTTITLSPGERKFTTAASRPPVPDDARI